MPEWYSRTEDRVEIQNPDGSAKAVSWRLKERSFKFNIDRTTLVLTGLVIAEIASWIDRYA